MTEFEIDRLWLPSSLGGRPTDPHPGLRLGIRWQRHLREQLENYRDVQIERLSLDSVISDERLARPFCGAAADWNFLFPQPGVVYQVLSLGEVVDVCVELGCLVDAAFLGFGLQAAPAPYGSCFRLSGETMTNIAARMARMCRRCGSGRVFWAGGPGVGSDTLLAAEPFAREAGGRTLEMTVVGRVLAQLTGPCHIG